MSSASHPATPDEVGQMLRSALAEGGETTRIGRGRPVYLAGEPATQLFLILDGKVKITRRSRQTPLPPTPKGPSTATERRAWNTANTGIREALLWLLGAGDLFGEQALVPGNRHIEQATCLSATRVVRIQADVFTALMADSPTLALAVTRYLTERLRRADDQAAGLALGTVPSRLAAALVYLAERFGTWTAAGVRVHHDLTQTELAQMVGASRETVNKTLTDFASRGWISVSPRTMMITDLDKLAQRVD